MPYKVRITDNAPINHLIEKLEVAADECPAAESLLERILRKWVDLSQLVGLSRHNTPKNTVFLGKFENQQLYMMLDRRMTSFFVVKGDVIYLYDVKFDEIVLPNGSPLGGTSAPVSFSEEALRAIADNLDDCPPEARRRALAWLSGKWGSNSDQVGFVAPRRLATRHQITDHRTLLTAPLLLKASILQRCAGAHAGVAYSSARKEDLKGRLCGTNVALDRVDDANSLGLDFSLSCAKRRGPASYAAY